MPSLSTYNRFDVLAIEQSNETIETVEMAMQIPESLPPSIPLLLQYPASRPKWEKPVPSKFIIAATEGNPTSLKLKIELETTKARDNVRAQTQYTRRIKLQTYTRPLTGLTSSLELLKTTLVFSNAYRFRRIRTCQTNAASCPPIIVLRYTDIHAPS